MPFSPIVRKMVAVADKLTADLQVDNQHFPWIGNDPYNQFQYGPVIIRKGIVEEKEYLRRLPNGQDVVQKATIIIPRPIEPNGAPDRKEPVDPRDKFVLPSGYTGPILGVFGEIDPATGHPYSYEIILG